MSTLKEVHFNEAIKRKYPEGISLIISFDKYNNRFNIMPACWVMSTSHNPPMFAISIGNQRYSLTTIKESRKVVISFPSKFQTEAMVFCGSHSGKNFDKVENTDLVAIKGSSQEFMLLDNACANFECNLENEILTGDHTIFSLRVLKSYVNPECESRLYSFGNGKYDTVNQ